MLRFRQQEKKVPTFVDAYGRKETDLSKMVPVNLTCTSQIYYKKNDQSHSTFATPREAIRLTTAQTDRRHYKEFTDEGLNNVTRAELASPRATTGAQSFRLKTQENERQ